MNDPLSPGAGALEVAEAVRRGMVAAQQVVEHALRRIERVNRAVNAFTALASARALERAARLDAQRRAGNTLGELAGVPFAVKAMIDVAGLPTTAGSALRANAPPATRDAAVVHRLEAAGAICIGALNMDEFGMGGTTENAFFGPTRNPHDMTRTPGGSSGGSAAALAAGMVPLAIGADGLGSIRLPASLCGVFGLRPTRGAISDEGVLSAGGTLATLGPMARSVADLAACYRLMSNGAAASDAEADAQIRIATAGGHFRESLDRDASEAMRKVMEALGVTHVVEYPDARRARAAAILVNATESATGKLEWLRTRFDEFDPSTRERFLAHALVPAQWYLQAQRYRARHIERVVKMFEDVDVIVVPATPCAAPKIGARTLKIEDAEVPMGPALGWFTQPLAGTNCPSLTVPVARPGRLPIGVQLMAKHDREDLLFRVAARLEHLGVVAAPVATACQ
jgi:aspartyl-tRNA(Asn)/glutamyl-tRNA(Gln) amidotransferase subunit A